MSSNKIDYLGIHSIYSFPSSVEMNKKDFQNSIFQKQLYSYKMQTFIFALIFGSCWFITMLVYCYCLSPRPNSKVKYLFLKSFTWWKYFIFSQDFHVIFNINFNKAGVCKIQISISFVRWMVSFYSEIKIICLTSFINKLYLSWYLF